MTTPLVSIIIPCFNGEKYVGEAIESALRQTYAHRELIVIDDGSRDRTLDVIRSFGDAIRWETGPNRGGSAARNRGLELARGELVQFLDADDLLHQEKLSRQVPLVLHGENDLVYCDGAMAPIDDPAASELVRTPYDGGDPFAFLAKYNVQVTAPIYRVAWLRGVGGFRVNLPCCQEYELHLRLALRIARLRRIPEILYNVRRVPRSVSSDTVKVFAERARILTGFFQELRRCRALSDKRAQALAERLAMDAMVLMDVGAKESCLRTFHLARTLHREGGLNMVYPTPRARLVHRIVGPYNLRRLVGLKRRLTCLLRRSRGAREVG
jgi:glycosyltransferase involved in cell wall biosynthesis